MNQLAAEGKTKHAIHKFQIKLNQILTEAELDDVIAVNPCRKILERVKPEETTRKSLSLAEAVSLAACLKSEPRDGYRVVVWLALALDLRRGELLGLQWRDVDWENCKICVQRQYNSRCELDEPKGGSKATISFDTGTKRFLLEWKVIQAQQYAEYGRTPTLETPICSPTVLVKDGRAADYIEPTNFDRWRRHYFADHGLGEFTKIREVKTKRGEIETKYSGYEGYNLHELRHTQATLLIGNNVDLKTVQSRLRHSSASTTMGTYAHAIDSNDELAAETIGELLNL